MAVCTQRLFHIWYRYKERMRAVKRHREFAFTRQLHTRVACRTCRNYNDPNPTIPCVLFTRDDSTAAEQQSNQGDCRQLWLPAVAAAAAAAAPFPFNRWTRTTSTCDRRRPHCRRNSSRTSRHRADGSANASADGSDCSSSVAAACAAGASSRSSHAAGGRA